MNNKQLAKFHSEVNGTRQYLVDEDNLQWLLGVAKDMLQKDFENAPEIGHMIKANIQRIENCQNLLNEE